MKSKAQKRAEALRKAVEPGDGKRYVAARRVQAREIEGWEKILVDGEPVTQDNHGSVSYLMVSPKG